MTATNDEVATSFCSAKHKSRSATNLASTLHERDGVYHKTLRSYYTEIAWNFLSPLPPGYENLPFESDINYPEAMYGFSFSTDRHIDLLYRYANPLIDAYVDKRRTMWHTFDLIPACLHEEFRSNDRHLQLVTNYHLFRGDFVPHIAIKFFPRESEIGLGDTRRRQDQDVECLTFVLFLDLMEDPDKIMDMWRRVCQMPSLMMFSMMYLGRAVQKLVREYLHVYMGNPTYEALKSTLYAGDGVFLREVTEKNLHLFETKNRDTINVETGFGASNANTKQIGPYIAYKNLFRNTKLKIDLRDTEHQDTWFLPYSAIATSDIQLKPGFLGPVFVSNKSMRHLLGGIEHQESEKMRLPLQDRRRHIRDVSWIAL